MDTPGLQPDETGADPTIPAILEDEGLSCPRCRYSLTGLTRQRCPECGAPFDVGELRRLASERATGSTPWDTRHGWIGFWSTWLLALADPRRLTDGLSRRPLLEEASR